MNDLMLVSPGTLAISREPMTEIPDGCRLATPQELLAAHGGHPFPWGDLPDDARASPIWRAHRIGIGGLKHTAWFMTSGGRFGGAPNVPTTLPGSLRCFMRLDGGGSLVPGRLEENEGFAVVRETSEEDQRMYRLVQLHAARHVVADGGGIIVSPVDEDRRVRVGFVGRCQVCPSYRLITLPQLQEAVPDYRFEPWPEWQA